MVYPVTAQDEILKRIQALDREESTLRQNAADMLADAARSAAETEAQAEAKAVLRRQYEFALTQLGGEIPKRQQETGVLIPVKKTGHLVASLG